MRNTLNTVLTSSSVPCSPSSLPSSVHSGHGSTVPPGIIS